MSGDGGDEIFVGYPWYRKGRMRELIYSNKLFSEFIKWPEINNYYENFKSNEQFYILTSGMSSTIQGLQKNLNQQKKFTV